MIHIDENFVTWPVNGDLDFKELFQEAISARAGLSLVKPADKSSEWTPSLLAEALSLADPRGHGVDVRTVQNWFQDNDKGISSENIMCLARVFGSGDPNAVAAWRTELRAANKRLVSKRRKGRKSNGELKTVLEATGVDSASNRKQRSQKEKNGLARLSEKTFTSSDGFGIAMLVWAGFFLLCLMSFIVQNHDITYPARLGLNKQVGFFWSLSWPIECLFLYPTSFLLIAPLVSFWKRESCQMVQSVAQRSAWDAEINSLRLLFWVAAIVAFVFVFAVQWAGVYLLGLTHKDAPDLVDWILVAHLRPDVVSLRGAFLVSLFAFLYSGLIYWFYFTGLLLLFAVSDDYYKRATSTDPKIDGSIIEIAGKKIQRAIFNCTVIGMLVANVIQLNAIYLKSDGETSLSWLANDSLAGLGLHAGNWALLDQSSVSSLTSSILLLLHFALFGVCTAKVRSATRASQAGSLMTERTVGEGRTGRRHILHDPLTRQICILGLLCLNFGLLGQFVGFTLLLFVTVVFAALGICWLEKET